MEKRRNGFCINSYYVKKDIYSLRGKNGNIYLGKKAVKWFLNKKKWGSILFRLRKIAAL